MTFLKRLEQQARRRALMAWSGKPHITLKTPRRDQ